MSDKVISITKHKYKWRFQEIFSVIFFTAVPVALWFLTPKPLFWSVGSISFSIAIFLVYIGASRKHKSALTATVYENGIVAISGNGLENSSNRVKISNVGSVRWEKYAHHPTIILSTNSKGAGLKLPRRVAEEEPLNTYLRKNLPKNLYVVDEAKSTLNDILEDYNESNGKRIIKPLVSEDSEDYTVGLDNNSLSSEDIKNHNGNIDKALLSDDSTNVPENIPKRDIDNLSILAGTRTVTATKIVKTNKQRIQPRKTPKSKR